MKLPKLGIVTTTCVLKRAFRIGVTSTIPRIAAKFMPILLSTSAQFYLEMPFGRFLQSSTRKKAIF
jgi:hypothetical protein